MMGAVASILVCFKAMIFTIMVYCLPVIRYTAGVVKQNIDDLGSTDRKTRKLLTIHRGFHPRSDVDRLVHLQEERR